jgi:hypothetical protein
MTPDEVDRLDSETYMAFVQFMQREAREIERASKRRR